MAKEIWKRIKDFPKYEVSNMGRIKSYKGIQPRILKFRLAGHGKSLYKNVTLYNNGISWQVAVAILVAKHFIGPRPKGMQVSHKNENCFDNRAINLCYETPAQNSNRPIHRKRISQSKSIGKSGYKGVRLRVNGTSYVAKIRHNRQCIHIGTYDTAKEAAMAFDAKVEELQLNLITTNRKLGLL